MALFKMLQGDESRISTDITPFHEGWCYVTNSGFMYIDMNLGTEEEPNNQRICLKSDVTKKLIETNNLSEINLWIGTKEEYNALSEEEKINCLCITTDDLEDVSFESISNKTVIIDENANNITYPTTLAVKNYMSNIDGYEKTENKDTVISNASDDNHYPTSKAVYDNVNNTVNSAKETILQTVEDRVYGVEKQSNKVTEITEDAKHTTYPSSRAVYEAIKTFGGTDIETTDVIDENSTTEEVPNAQAVYNFVMNSTPDSVPAVYTGTSEPDASTGKVGDFYIII